jgi:hypothetical protein
MSLEKLIVLSSEDKAATESSSNSDFIVNLKERYYTQNILKVLVKECSVPNVFPNIRGSDYGSSSNNTFVIRDNTVRTITLPEGQYLINSSNPALDFTTILQNALNAVSTSTWVVSYNELTNKIEFEITAGFPVFLFSNVPPFGDPTSTMSEVLGLTDNIQILVGNTGVPQGQVDLSGYQNVYLHSKEIALSHAIDGDFGLISMITPISLSDAPFGSYAYRKNDDDELSQISYDDVRNLKRIRLTLRDNKGNILPVGTHKISLTLLAFLASG